MKTKFANLDICAVVHDLKRLIGMRVINVYDIDSKTYLVKLHKPTDKAFILFESGVRIHVTTHDWSKSQMPSGFSMKFRKHIRQRRLSSVSQIGVDRIVDMTFGDEEYACHVIVELYDRGNIILTDSEYKILNVLRPRTDRDHDVRFSVREIYPVDLARKETFVPSMENIKLFLESAKPTDLLRKTLVRHVPFSGQLLEHGFLKAGLPANVQIKDILANENGVEMLGNALRISDVLLKEIAEQPSKGYITFKKVTNPDSTTTDVYEEYNPISFAQYSLPDSTFSVKEFPTFSEAVDNFYSQLDSQKVQQRSLQVENEAIKKLDNVKKDHERRLKALNEVQENQQKRAELIEMNRDLVDQCLTVVRQALANKMPWDEIQKWISSAAVQDNPIAKTFVRLNLLDNSIVLKLFDPYEHLDSEEPVEASSDDEESNQKKKKQSKQKPKAKEKGMDVELDLDLTADQNARQHFTDRKAAAVKQQKTLQSSNVALKNAQKQAHNKVKQVRTNTTLARARKVMWFEKFYWCISSDGYLIIGGRDAQQNEMVVKRYLRPGDIYVHADLAGASSVVVRNKSKDAEIPPMTLNEAGSMAVCYSNAWEAKVVVSAWWVHHSQVSRTAPTGEFLTAGSFMIRGKKNFLPSIQLQLGFGLMFRLDEESAERRIAELKERQSTRANSVSTDLVNEGNEQQQVIEDDVVEEIELNKDGQHVEDEEEPNEDNDEEFPDVKVDLESLNLNSTTGAENEDLILMSLTPDPKPDDGLLFITAVCGPYSTMQKFKYKVKITPGNGKRGKAVKTALALFQTDKTATTAERALVKMLASDPAIIQQLPSKVNVLAPQLMKVRK